MKPLASHSGMTLIEVLVALVVIAVSLGAVVSNINQSVSDFDDVRARSFAHWVAMNRATELQLSLAASPGKTQTEELLAGRDWRVETTVTALSDSEVLRAEIKVFPDDESDAALATVATYIGKTPPVTEKQEQPEDPGNAEPDSTDRGEAEQNPPGTASGAETVNNELGP